MNVLFVHQNFPGQFKFLAPALAARGHRVVALAPRLPAGADAGPPPSWKGVSLVTYPIQRGSTPGLHRWVADLETKVIRGEACFRAALALRDAGFVPDVVIAHPGWGESLFLHEVWPDARLGMYCEFFYHPRGADVGFDPEFPATDPGDACRVGMLNANNLLHMQRAAGGLSPTHWQASTFPEPFRSRISVVHDGIDTDALVPRPDTRVELAGTDGRNVVLDPSSEVVTFVNRNLEPYRGYHVFMRALPALLARRPRLQVVIVGGDGTSYGAPPDPARWGGRSWKRIFIDEVRERIPKAAWSRVHFVGRVPYDRLVALLCRSTVHVYLTYPFVLSWSLLESMSLGCTIVGSDTAPLREAIVEGETGRLVDFFDHRALSSTIESLLDDPAQRAQLGAAARAFARERYDLARICLPGQLAWAEGLAA